MQWQCSYGLNYCTGSPAGRSEGSVNGDECAAGGAGPSADMATALKLSEGGTIQLMGRPFKVSAVLPQTGTVAEQYTAGLIILAAAPCTAMVFVWSYLTAGDPAYTLVQVAVNDLIMLVAFAPIVMFLCGVAPVVVPAKVLITSVVVFIVIPLTAGWLGCLGEGA